jgi:hypothetical protein
VKGDLVAPLETLPPALQKSMGEPWRHKQENLEELKKEQAK